MHSLDGRDGHLLLHAHNRAQAERFRRRLLEAPSNRYVCHLTDPAQRPTSAQAREIAVLVLLLSEAPDVGLLNDCLLPPETAPVLVVLAPAAGGCIAACQQAGYTDILYDADELPLALIEQRLEGAVARHRLHRRCARQHEAELRLAQSLAACAGLLAQCATDGRMLWINGALQQRCGQPHYASVVHPIWTYLQLPDEQAAWLRTALAEGRETDLVLSARDQEARPFHWRTQLRRIDAAGDFLLSGPDVSRERRLQHQLAITSEQQELMARFGRELLWSVNTVGVFTWFSPNVEQLMGYHPERALVTDDDLLMPESRRMLNDVLAPAAWEETRERRVELEFRAFDGSGLWTDTDLHPRFDANHTFCGLMGISASIQRRKEIGAELHDSEARYRLLFEAVHDPVFLFAWDPNDQPQPFTDLNRAACRLTGRAREELLARSLSELVANPDALTELGEALHRARYARGDLHLRDGHGHRRICDCSCSLLRFSGRRLVLLVARDSNHRRRREWRMHSRHIELQHRSGDLERDLFVAQGRRRQLEEIIQQVLEAVPGPAWIVDEHGAYRHANSALARCCGINAADIPGRSHFDLWPKALAARLVADDHALTHKAPSANTTLRLADATAAGQALPVRLYRQSLRAQEGKQQGCVTLCLPLTSGLVSDGSGAGLGLLAALSHEIRTPMNGIMGMTELLLSSPLDGDQQDWAQIVYQSAERLLSLLADIIDFDRLCSDRLVLDRRSFALRELVHDIVQGADARLSRTRQRLIVRIDPQIPNALIGDPARLGQILNALIGNAIKRTTHGHVICDCGLRARDGLHLRLGIHIDNDDVALTGVPETLFDIDSPEDLRRQDRAGIDLAISRRLVELMGGGFRIEAGAQGGSRIAVEIPLGIDERRLGAFTDDLPLAGRRVLIIDPHPAARASWQELLRQAGAQPRSIGDLTALTTLIEHGEIAYQPDIVVLSCRSWTNAVTSVIARLVAQKIRVLILSAGATPIEREAYWRIGANGHLDDPFPPGRLVDAVARICAGEHGIVGPGERRLETTSRRRICHPWDELHVLVVDDDPIGSRVIRLLLERRGVHVGVVGNGEEALTAFTARHHDLIIMDCDLPGIDGLETTRRIRRHERRHGGHIPIIALTAAGWEQDQEACLAAGMDGYLRKPLGEAALIAAIDHWR